MLQEAATRHFANPAIEIVWEFIPNSIFAKFLAKILGLSIPNSTFAESFAGYHSQLHIRQKEIAKKGLTAFLLLRVGSEFIKSVAVIFWCNSCKLSAGLQEYHPRMSFVLSHISSSQYLVSHADISSYKAMSHAKALISQPTKFDPSRMNDLPGVELPLHILTSEHSLRRQSKNLRPHIWMGSLPKGSILDTSKNFYVCSPELTFVQMANVLSLPNLIELGFTFCGIYTIINGEIYPSEQLTSVARLKTFISKMNKVQGIKKAGQAVQYIVENSASPLESILTMLLCLPYRLGGYGIPRPCLNHPLKVRIKTGQTVSNRRYICDLYWADARLCIEYDSNKFHAGKEKIAQDSIRRTDLASKSITVISVTYPQIKNSVETHKLAHLIAKKLGKHLCYPEPGFSQARMELRNTLFGRG